MTINGKDIKKIREWMGMTQVQFAKGLGIHVATVSRWECDVIKVTGPARVVFERMQREMDATDV